MTKEQLTALVDFIEAMANAVAHKAVGLSGENFAYWHALDMESKLFEAFNLRCLLDIEQGKEEI